MLRTGPITGSFNCTMEWTPEMHVVEQAKRAGHSTMAPLHLCTQQKKPKLYLLGR